MGGWAEPRPAFKAAFTQSRSIPFNLVHAEIDVLRGQGAWAAPRPSFSTRGAARAGPGRTRTRGAGPGLEPAAPGTRRAGTARAGPGRTRTGVGKGSSESAGPAPTARTDVWEGFYFAKSVGFAVEPLSLPPNH